MDEILSEEEIGNIVAGLRNGGKFADWPQHTALAFLRLVEAERDRLKAPPPDGCGWGNLAEERQRIIAKLKEIRQTRHITYEDIAALASGDAK